ncbi:MAG: tetratricopeptide repeat protein [Pseudomonadota bacterium]
MTDPEQLRGEAQQCLRRGDIERARQLLDQLAAADPGDWLSPVQLAELYESQGAFAAALDHARQALERKPGDPKLLAKIGLLAQKAAQPEAAAAAYERAIAGDAAFRHLKFNLANCWFAVGRFSAAADAYEDVLAERPDHDVARANLAEALEKLARYGEAQRHADELLARAPVDPRWLALKGRLALREQQLDVAEDALSRALASASSPADAPIRLNLASVHFEQKRYAEALARLNEIAGPVEPFPQALRLRFLCHYQAGAVSEALTSATDIFRSGNHESAMVALSLLPQLLLEAGRNDEARELLGLDTLLKLDRLELSAASAEALKHTVHQHPSLQFEPATTSTHNGSQTESLLDPATPEVNHLAEEIQVRIIRYAETCRGSDGPYARFLPAQGRLKMWAVALNSGGYQGSHMHPHGVVSGVYYLQVPGAEDPDAGAIEMGRPESKFALRCDPMTRTVPVATGDLVLFPSYLFHRTLPFDSPERRISIAFDLVPPTSPEWQDPGLSAPFPLA